MRRQATRREKVFASHTPNEGLAARPCKGRAKPNSKKPRKPVRKQAKDVRFSPKRRHGWEVTTRREGVIRHRAAPSPLGAHTHPAATVESSDNTKCGRGRRGDTGTRIPRWRERKLERPRWETACWPHAEPALTPRAGIQLRGVCPRETGPRSLGKPTHNFTGNSHARNNLRVPQRRPPHRRGSGQTVGHAQQ